MQKDRITLSVCVNATGTDKLKLLVIHTAKRPRDFGKTWMQLICRPFFQHKSLDDNAGMPHCTLLPTQMPNLL